MEIQIHIHIDRAGQRYGPYSLADAKQYLSEGTLLSTDSAWHDGLADWIPLAQVEGIAEGSGHYSKPPPPSPRSSSAAGPRPVPAYAEEQQKCKLVLILGILLTLSALLPVYNPAGGMMGSSASSFMFPTFKFEGKPGMAIVQAILPLILGITLCSIAYTTRAIARSIVLLSLGGVSLIITLVASSNSGTSMGYGGGPMDGISHVAAGTMIFFVGWTCLLMGAGTRYYRPANKLAFILAVVGGGFLCLFWFIPDNGLPLVQVFKSFKGSVLLGFGMLAWMLMVIAGSVLSFVNLPSRPANTAHRLARLSAFLVMGSLLVLAAFIMLASMADSQGMGKMSDRFKVGFMFLTFLLTMGVSVFGQLLLLPLGGMDLFTGRADR